MQDKESNIMLGVLCDGDVNFIWHDEHEGGLATIFILPLSATGVKEAIRSAGV
jgi:hypothetical protein